MQRSINYLLIRNNANTSSDQRNHSVDLKQNFHTPAFTTKLIFEHSERTRGSKSFNSVEHNDRYDNRKEDYATCKLYFTLVDINKATENSSRKNNINEITVQNLNHFETKENEKKESVSYMNPSERMKHEMIKKMMERMKLNDAHTENEENLKTLKRLDSLYQQAKTKNEKNRKLYEQNNEDRLKKEMQECTFKPKLSLPPKQKREKDYSNNVKSDFKKFHERNMKWKQQIDEKYLLLISG